MGRGSLLIISITVFVFLISGVVPIAQAADNPQNGKRASFVDDDWDPVDRSIGDDFLMLPVDTLFLFASSGREPGAWRGTDERGYNFDDEGGGGAAPAGWTSVDETQQDGEYWHLADAQMNAGRGTLEVLDIPRTTPARTTTPCGAVGRMSAGGETAPATATTGISTWSSISGISVPEPTSSTISGSWGTTRAARGTATITGNCWPATGTADFRSSRKITLSRSGPPSTTRVTGPSAWNRLVFRFVSDHGWSDEDGLYNSDLGAVWIDHVSIITAFGVYDEDFEDGLVPAGFTFETPPGAGDYAELYSNLYSEDKVNQNTSHAWAFFDLNTENPEYPIPVVAYGPEYVDNSIVSPVLDAAHEIGNPTGGPVVLDANHRLLLDYWCYYDNPLDPLVFQTWSIAAKTEELPCLSTYYGDGAAWYSDAKQWATRRHEGTIPALLSANGGTIEALSLKLNVVDLCDIWCGIFGSGENHTPAPYYDNVRLMLINKAGLGAQKKQAESFQDGVDDADRGNVRIDMAADVRPYSDPVVLPGDSAVFHLNMELLGGTKTHFDTDAGKCVRTSISGGG